MRRDVPVLALLILCAFGLVPFLEKGTSELPVYTTAGERLLAQEEIYRRDHFKPFTYPTSSTPASPLEITIR